MFTKDNYINSLWGLIENNLKTQFPNFNVTKQKLNITSVSQGEYHICILYPRTSKLSFAAEYQNSEKKVNFRIDLFCIGIDDFASTYLMGKIDEYVSHNQDKFKEFGLRKVELSDGIKINDSRIYSSQPITNISAYVCTLSGVVWL